MFSLGLGLVFGLLLGSLSKCLADRSTSDESFLGRSYCPRCKHQLRWYDLFPIFSFLFLKGKCRYCHTKIPFEYPLVELATSALVTILFVIYLPDSTILSGSVWVIIPILELILKIFVVLVAIITFLTDIKTGLIPDRITFPSIYIGFGLKIALLLLQIAYIGISLSVDPLGQYMVPPYSNYFYMRAWELILGLSYDALSAIGAGIFFGLIILLTRGRGMGGGDLKLAIFMGLVLGFPGIIVALMFAFLSGSVVGLILILIRQKKMNQTIPFGPFLSLGMIVALIWGQQIANWYVNLHGLN